MKCMLWRRTLVSLHNEGCVILQAVVLVLVHKGGAEHLVWHIVLCKARAQTTYILFFFSTWDIPSPHASQTAELYRVPQTLDGVDCLSYYQCVYVCIRFYSDFKIYDRILSSVITTFSSLVMWTIHKNELLSKVSLCPVCLQLFLQRASTDTHRLCLIQPTQRPPLKTASLQWEIRWPESLMQTWQQL